MSDTSAPTTPGSEPWDICEQCGLPIANPKEQTLLRASLHRRVARQGCSPLSYAASHLRGLRLVRDELSPPQQGRQILLGHLRRQMARSAGPEALRPACD